MLRLLNERHDPHDRKHIVRCVILYMHVACDDQPPLLTPLPAPHTHHPRGHHRLLDSFTHKGHLCLVFELLDMNLYELLKQNQFRGLPLPLIRSVPPPPPFHPAGFWVWLLGCWAPCHGWGFWCGLVVGMSKGGVVTVLVHLLLTDTLHMHTPPRAQALRLADFGGAVGDGGGRRHPLRP